VLVARVFAFPVPCRSTNLRQGIEMEIFSVSWWSALAAIVVIDLVLAGDNALVIGMAAGRLEPALRRRAILWGSAGALVARAAMALAVVWLLAVPGLLLAGGLLLLPIAYRLAVPSGDAGHARTGPAASFWAAMKTIVVADALMGLDNVLAIGGAAHGNWELVLIGLAVTVPLIVWGSGWVARAIDRWPVLTPAGAAVLALTGAGMIVGDPLFDSYFVDHPVFDWCVKAAVTAVVFAIGVRAAKRSRARTRS
jgi:YjbE family integral membrane protein